MLLQNSAPGGTGAYVLEYADHNWGKLPEEYLLCDVTDVGVDSRDNVYVFTRGAHPVIVFDTHGAFLRSWGEGVFTRPHGLHVGPDDAIYCTDDGDHTVRKFTPEGRLLLEIGDPGRPSPTMSGQPFNRCTHTALSPSGEIYVSDGYGNARVHKYTPDGKLLHSWGGPGTGPGEFNIAHNICCDTNGWVYVADRENHRIQVFDSEGRFECEWTNVHRPCGMCYCANHEQIYVAELAPGREFSNRDWPKLGPRVSVFGTDGELRARLGDLDGAGQPSAFVGPHGIAVDSKGAIYVGELSSPVAPRQGSEPAAGRDLVCLRKLAPNAPASCDEASGQAAPQRRII